MSLYQAVYGEGLQRPPYADAAYYGKITHPSPQFIQLLANVAVRLAGGANHTAAPALWRLDQAMGGGKSHGLIGLYHLAADPKNLSGTDVGKQALTEACSIAGDRIPSDLNSPQVVVLACDNMTAGKGVYDLDGPAVTLHERFLWRLFGGDRAMYDRYKDHHADKSKIVDALRAVNRPVLILVDEIMDYIRQLSDRALHDLAIRDLAFLRALLDSVNDVANVAMVVVMIASEKDSMDLDREGQSRRGELDQLLVRNGKPATINDNTDFAAILRRRLFEAPAPSEVVEATAKVFAHSMNGSWQSKVFDTLGASWTKTWEEEVSRCYPFHPQLISLAEQEWSKLSGFQKVRSTIRIFAATVYTLSKRTERGEWAPLLIGPGDLPLSQDSVREAIIGSGLIADPRAQSNFRSLASADIVSGDDQTGSARILDKERNGSSFDTVNPRVAERGATCLFLCSVVGSRGGGRQGASEPELKAAMFTPSAKFGLADADSVLNDLKDVDGGGLASVEVIPGKGGHQPRLVISTRQTLNMLVRAARGTISEEERDAEIANAAERLSSSGPFKVAMFVAGDLSRSPREVLETAGIDDARSTRLVVLDPRQFSLLNGIDKDTRAAVRAAMGLGEDKFPVQWASSAVYAIVNTQRRGLARGAAVTYLAWTRVCEMSDVQSDPELADKARSEKVESKRNLETAIRRAYQHVMYLDLADESNGEVRIEKTITFEHENQSSLDGTTVWMALFEAQKVVDVGTFNAKALLHNLRANDYGKPLDEVRDLFWGTPRVPLLPGGESDLQRAIYEAVAAGSIALVGNDGVERSVTGPSEIGIGQSGVRLSKPLPPEPETLTEEPTLGDTPVDEEKSVPPGREGEKAGGQDKLQRPPVAEKQIAFSLRTSLLQDQPRDTLYALLQALADMVDEGKSSYAEVMFKVRVDGASADAVADLVRKAGGNPDLRDV
ncbi:AAA family ATPase [Pseudarthrobacter sp. AB1]|nr:AAA family ATPase [Pseudarthrobacter sp. AB1]